MRGDAREPGGRHPPDGVRLGEDRRVPRPLAEAGVVPQQVDPAGLTSLLVGLHETYPGLPLVVTENGAAYPDTVSDDGKAGSTVDWKGGFYRGFPGNDPPANLSDDAAKTAVHGAYMAGLENLKKLIEAGTRYAFGHSS